MTGLGWVFTEVGVHTQYYNVEYDLFLFLLQTTCRCARSSIICRTIISFYYLTTSTCIHCSCTLAFCCLCQGKFSKLRGNVMYNGLNRSYILNTSCIGIFNIDEFQWRWSSVFDIQLLHKLVYELQKHRLYHLSLCPIKCP